MSSASDAHTPANSSSRHRRTTGPAARVSIPLPTLSLSVRGLPTSNRWRLFTRNPVAPNVRLAGECPTHDGGGAPDRSGAPGTPYGVVVDRVNVSGLLYVPVRSGS